MDTIYALSSGLLPSGVAIIRVSGSQTRFIIESFLHKLPAPRIMTYGVLRSCFTPCKGEILDEALTVFFPGPHSFTGEDCAEFHLHGSKAVVARFLEELGSFSGCRMAEAGEFSRRAFLNNRIDLTTAEGLSDLIEAETESQRRLALGGARGLLAEKYRLWRSELLEIRAWCETAFDFSEEEDIDDSIYEKLWDKLAILQQNISEHIRYGEAFNALRDGLKIVIIGAPNAGKSSLINFLSQKQVALVSDHPGTTRDVVEIRLRIGQHMALISDTAGIRETEEEIEVLGIAQTFSRLKEADLILYLEDMLAPKTLELPKVSGEIWRIGTKRDLFAREFFFEDARKSGGYEKRWDLCISVNTGENIDSLFSALEKFVLKKTQKIGDAFPARERQIRLLKDSLKEIEEVFLAKQKGLEYAAEHLRLASNALGRITGDIDVEDLLDVIFSQFCIGK